MQSEPTQQQSVDIFPVMNGRAYNEQELMLMSETDYAAVMQTMLEKTQRIQKARQNNQTVLELQQKEQERLQKTQYLIEAQLALSQEAKQVMTEDEWNKSVFSRLTAASASEPMPNIEEVPDTQHGETVSTEDVQEQETEQQMRTIFDRFGPSTNKGLFGFLIIFILFGVGCYYWTTGMLESNPDNASAQRLLDSLGPRLLSNPMIAIVAFMFVIVAIWLAFPSLIAYWHSDVRTEISFNHDFISLDSKWRICVFCFFLWFFKDLFMQALAVIFG